MRASLMTGLALAAALSGCGDTAKLVHHEDTGPQPTLPEPTRRIIPTVNVAPAKGWPAGATPTPAAGLGVSLFARDLQHPRWLYVLPNGDVLVAETNAPDRPDDGKGIKAKVMKLMRKKAGAGVPSANRISLLRDSDGDGVAELRTVFVANLVSPFGMALIGDTFYVANADAIVKFPYRRGETTIAAAAVKVADLPGGPINHHWTKSLIASADGTRLYVGVGSNSNVAENGIDVEKNRASVLEIDPATGSSRVYASGLRNPVGLAWQPFSGGLWAVVNERDELGSDLVPDYLTSVREGAFYGWPYSYYGQHVDKRAKPPRADLVARAIAPDYALGAHVAPLGLAFNTARTWPAAYQNGAFVGLHGSWNRKPPNGYKVSFVPFSEGMPKGGMMDVLDGFLDAEGNARGRPVGLAIDTSGGLLVADDVGDIVWRVAPR